MSGQRGLSIVAKRKSCFAGLCRNRKDVWLASQFTVSALPACRHTTDLENVTIFISSLPSVRPEYKAFSFQDRGFDYVLHGSSYRKSQSTLLGEHGVMWNDDSVYDGKVYACLM
jgi:hypothetical protein